MVPDRPARRPQVKAFVYVVDSIVARIRAVDPAGTWKPDERGYVEASLGQPLGALEAARRFPILSPAPG